MPDENDLDENDLDACDVDFAEHAVSDTETDLLPLFPNGEATPEEVASWKELFNA